MFNAPVLQQLNVTRSRDNGRGDWCLRRRTVAGECLFPTPWPGDLSRQFLFLPFVFWTAFGLLAITFTGAAFLIGMCAARGHCGQLPIVLLGGLACECAASEDGGGGVCEMEPEIVFNKNGNWFCGFPQCCVHSLPPPPWAPLLMRSVGSLLL